MQQIEGMQTRDECRTTTAQSTLQQTYCNAVDSRTNDARRRPHPSKCRVDAPTTNRRRIDRHPQPNMSFLIIVCFSHTHANAYINRNVVSFVKRRRDCRQPIAPQPSTKRRIDAIVAKQRL
jgi:hypothetical protein